MLTVNKLIPQARGLAPALTRRAASVEIDWDVRQRSRFDAIDSTGRALGVFLPRGSIVRGGDVLVGEDGSLIVVKAAVQPVLVVTPCPEHGTPFDLMRAAYHLGNRHVALELRPDRLQLEPDHVLAGLLRQMDLIVGEAQAAFEPENGAYAATGHAHVPAASASDGHDRHTHEEHAHGPHSHASPRPERGATLQVHEQQDHGHHDRAALAAGHVHGPGCNHDHPG